jgi:zinc protease
MKRLLLAVLTLLCVAAPAAAADPKALALGHHTEVWFSEDHTVPMVAFVFSLPAGSGYDPAAKPGLAAFAGAMLDEGAAGLDSRAFHTALANRAIQLSVTPERDSLVVTILTLSADAPEALHLLSLALSRPRFDAESVMRVRDQMLQALAQDDQDPSDVANRAFLRAFFNGHVYGHAVDGETAGLSAVTAEDLRAFARSHWVRGGLKIAVAGDITAPVLTRLLKTALAPLPANTPPQLPSVGRLGQPGVHYAAMAAPQPTAVFGLPGIMRSDRDFLPGYIANYILGGGGFASRLTNEVRVKRGLTYDISTDLLNFQRASVLTGEVASRPETMKQAISVIRDTMADFAANGPTDQELADAKTYLTGSFPLIFASDAGTAAQLGIFQREGLGLDYVAKRNALIQAVTIDDVRRVAKRLFTPARLTIVIAGATTNARPQAAKPSLKPRPDH